MNAIPWWQAPAIAFDTESTGINVQTDRIVTIAMVHLAGAEMRPERFLVNPGVEIPAAATAIHGIATAKAKAEGVDPGPAIDATAGALALAMRHGQPVIGMNVSYDLSLLHFECVRHGVPTLSDRLDGRIRPVVDVYVLDKQADKYRKGSRKLNALCEYYGVKHHGAHDSAYDALASAMVAARIAERFPAVGKLTLDELHDSQVKWAAEQRSGLQEHFDRTLKPGEDRKVVEPGWPLLNVAGGVR